MVFSHSSFKPVPSFNDTAPYKNLPLPAIASNLPAFTKNFTGTPKICFIILKLSRALLRPLYFPTPNCAFLQKD